jgi:DNA polymerase-3 subunit beta
MKFIVSTSTLLKHLQFSVGIISGKAVLPAIDNFLFELENEHLKIISTDLETTLVTELKVESNDTIRVLVPARMLIDTLKTFPDQPIVFKIDDKKYTVEIVTDNGKFKMGGSGAVEFPNVPTVKSKTTIEISSGILKNAISKTIFACGKDDIRLVMSGLFMDFTNDSLNCVATDAHRLVQFKIPELKTEMPFNLIVPKKPLSIIKNELKEDETPVIIKHNNKQVFFNYGHITVITKCIEGKYPNYEAVIPLNNNKKLIINREQFINSLRRTLFFSARKNYLIRLHLTKDGLEIKTEDIDFGNEAVEKLTCQYEGEDMVIGFNGNTLIELLSNIDTDEVLMELSAPVRAGLIYPTGANVKSNVLMLLMPIMVEG